MNFFQFVTAWWVTNVELVRATAWPVVVMASVWILRKPLAELLPRVEKIRAGNNEVIFRKQVERLKEEADNLDIPKLPAMQATLTVERKRRVGGNNVEVGKLPELPEFDHAEFLFMINQPGQSPAFSVYAAMYGLQSDMNILLDYRLDHEPFSSLPPRSWAGVLKREGYISDRTEDLIQGLYKAYDSILNGGQKIRVEDAIDFSKLVARARLAIRADYANIRASSADVTADSIDIRADNESNMPSEPEKD